jgi:hypothetical protein
MKNNKKQILLFASIFIVLVAIAFAFFSTTKVNDMPGTVIGDNPKNIPESKLPACNAPAGGIINEPCYSPPGMMYL